MLHGVMRANHARSRTIPIAYPSFSTTFGESKHQPTPLRGRRLTVNRVGAGLAR